MECPYHILIRNCRGAGSREFVDNFKETTREHHPVVCLILDTCRTCVDARELVKQLGYTGIVTVYLVGYT